jgi:beta-lactamase class A
LGSAQTPQSPAPIPVATQVQSIAAEHHGGLALFAEDLKTHQTVSISSDTPVQTASVIKAGYSA